MTFPTLYKPSDIGKLYQPRTAEFMAEGLKANLSPATEDKKRTILVIVDNQVDFIHQDGTLSVPGALDDVERLIGWIYRNVGELTAIAASLDSHIPMQIFFSLWWENAKGEHPEPFTLVTYDDIRNGKWRATIDPKWSIAYVEELDKLGRHQLMIWPYHTMIGTPGHTLVPPLSEAIAYHSAARNAQPTFLTKGMIPQVEHYGIWEPEVPYPEHPQGGTNTSMLDLLARYDLIYFAGEAKSHCVLNTMRQTLEYFANQPEVIEKIHFLTDCTSSVEHPDIDFEAIAQAELEKMETRGVVMVESKESIK